MRFAAFSPTSNENCGHCVCSLKKKLSRSGSAASTFQTHIHLRGGPPPVEFLMSRECTKNGRHYKGVKEKRKRNTLDV